MFNQSQYFYIPAYYAKIPVQQLFMNLQANIMLDTLKKDKCFSHWEGKIL